MANGQTKFARYDVIRDHHVLWSGDPAQKGARFREVCMTSDESITPVGRFQVYCLASEAEGIVERVFRVAAPELLFDADFEGWVEAHEKFKELVQLAEKAGFRTPSMMDYVALRKKLLDAQHG